MSGHAWDWKRKYRDILFFLFYCRRCISLFMGKVRRRARPSRWYIYTSIKKSGDIKSMESSGWYNWNIQLFCSSQSCFWKPIFRGKVCWCKSLDDCCKSLLCKSQIEDRPRKVKWQIISFCGLAPKLGFAGSRTLSINTTFVKASTLKVQHNIFLQIRERTILLDRNQMIKYDQNHEKAQL